MPKGIYVRSEKSLKYYKTIKGKIPKCSGWNKGLKNKIPTENQLRYWESLRGRKLPPRRKDWCFKNSLGHIGEKNKLWKGDKVNYSALHKWVRRWKGNPIKCECCNKVGEKISRKWSLEWANTNHTYKRNLLDWIGLCQHCHRNYDIENNNFKYKNQYI